MRILHTADWHFGKTLEGRDRIGEQQQFVDELIGICAQERIDLVLMAGDVYQTVNPSAAAEALFYRALDGLSAGGSRGVVVIAGNHDNAERIASARPLADKLGMTLIGLPKDALSLTLSAGGVARVRAGAGFVELQLPGCAERAVIAAVPYPSEARLNEVLAETLDQREMQANYSERIRHWFASLARQYRPDTVNLALSHVYVAGGIESDSEVQIQIGGAYAVDPNVFPTAAHYIGLGHLHRPQAVAAALAPTRYAGSPLAYSFSEAGQAKSVVIVEASPGQASTWREVKLSCGRPLVRWQAETLAQVENWVEQGRDGDAWIDLEIQVQSGLQLEEIHRLRELHPGFVHIRPVLSSPDHGDALVAQDRERLSTAELFQRFFEQRQGVPADDALVNLFLQMVAETQAAPEDASDTADVRSPGEMRA